jgi:hypothetical protein
MDLIAELLKESLLETLGDDAGRAEKLRAAATMLGGRLAGEDRELTPHAILAAVGSGDAGSSTLDLAYEILVGEWETLPNAYPERPVELLRAVLLGAVAEAADRTVPVRTAGWYTLRSALEQGAGGRWTACLSSLLRQWQLGVDAEIKARWQPPPASSALRMPSLSEPAAFTMTSRQAILDRAQAVQAGPGVQGLYNELQATYAEDVKRLIELAEAAGLAGGRRVFDEVKKAFSELGTKLREAFELYESGLEAVRLRGELLWWQQSRYSPASKRGYGEFDVDADVVVAAALDLHELVLEVAPIAAEYVLAELVGSVTSANSVTFAELQEAATSERLPRSGAASTPATLLTALTSGTPKSAGWALDGKGELAADRAAVLLFRDLQAAAAVASERNSM